MSALDDVVLAVREGITQDNYEGWKKVEDARFELAQLRAAAAELQAAQERSAEQARQLEEARVIMQHFTGLKVAADRQMAYDWLAANAPQEQTA